ncbi:toll/interleukin-1 receptor domain-containing protein [Stenotrophomonas rhizophila]|uniref:toll/interleukin-1 receptor domain-containing protein n=1 Tax=Stenotrophomonas rhizophila TaxID=216778 RepID=UPI0010C12706|nr:toll/interleukin-1 receptor domain-containing protein [Stenotrophomonas rhizophila]TKK07020.1 hypothetical protein SrhCFBP13529_09350 [Stenotrophomonas rhizophila]
MLLKLRVRNFNGAGLKVDAAAVATLQERCHATWRAVAAYLMDSGTVLDAESVQQVVAPAFQPDVFLSHGRGDREQVLQLAVMLEQLGLTVFVDSCLWLNAYTVQQELDESLSARRNSPGTHHFHYHRVVRTSASLHMVFNAALQRLIDGCELFLHLEGEAEALRTCVEDGRHAGAPWVLSELMFARHLPRRGRPRLTLEALKSEADDGVAFGAPEAAHALEWEVLERAIADTTGFPTTSYAHDHPVFLDHLYGKLPLSEQERRLLGWL